MLSTLRIRTVSTAGHSWADSITLAKPDANYSPSNVLCDYSGSVAILGEQPRTMALELKPAQPTAYRGQGKVRLPIYDPASAWKRRTRPLRKSGSDMPIMPKRASHHLLHRLRTNHAGL